MKKNTEYEWHIGGLKEGKWYTAHYEIKADFWKEEEADDVAMLQKSTFSITLCVQKNGQLYTCTLQLTGTLCTECDRCLDAIELPLEREDTLLLKMIFSDPTPYNNTEKDPTIIYIHTRTAFFDMALWIRDTVLLSVPPMRTCAMNCSPKECNPAIVNRIGRREE